MYKCFLRVLQRFFGLPLPGSIEDKARRLRGVFSLLDKETALFRKKTGLQCPGGCGHCCATAGVETTELEMFPLALALEKAKKAEAFYRQAEEQGFEGRCVFYTPTEGHGSGCCAAYLQRPLICRLFGCAGNRDKHGKPRLVGCAVFKKTQPDEAEAAYEGVLSGKIRVPFMTEWVMRAAAVDPELSREHLPVNTAFKRALERVWLNNKYRSGK